MNKYFINLILAINKVFPEKKHPFNKEKDGILNLNYTDFEYDHCKDLLNMYSNVIDLCELKGKSILDIGCGGGGKSIYIAEHFGSKVMGIDINLNFLEQANKKANEKKVLDLVSFREEDALNLSFNKEQFDIVIMSDVIEHIPNTDILFKEVYRVLKKGGIVIFDFAPYYHYFGHHIWDTLRIPWLHIFTTEKFRISLYKESVSKLTDGSKRIDLRIGLNKNNKESFTYLNRISRRQFEKVLGKEFKRYSYSKVNYKMLKNISFFSKLPVLREVFIKHIIGVLRK